MSEDALRKLGAQGIEPDGYAGSRYARTPPPLRDLEHDEGVLYGMRIGPGPSKAKALAKAIADAMATDEYKNGNHPLHRGVVAEVGELFAQAEAIREEQERERKPKKEPKKGFWTS